MTCYDRLQRYEKENILQRRAQAKREMPPAERRALITKSLGLPGNPSLETMMQAT